MKAVKVCTFKGIKENILESISTFWDVFGEHSLVQGFVVEIQVFNDQLCGPQGYHLVFVALVSFFILIFSQFFSAKQMKDFRCLKTEKPNQIPIVSTCNAGSPPRSLSGDPLQCCGSSSTPPTCVLPHGVPWTDGKSAAVKAASPWKASVQQDSSRLTGEAAGPACSPCPSEGLRVWKPPPLIPQRVSSKSSCPASNAPGPNQYKT